MGYDRVAALWPEGFRRRFCRTVPPLEIAPGAILSGAAAEVAGVMLITAATRRVLDDARCDVEYGGVVENGTRSEEWFTLWVCSFADPIDYGRTAGRTWPANLPDGTTGQLWQRDPAQAGEWPVLTHYRDDFVPPTPMFRCAGTGWTLVSDALASDLLRSGLEGITLQDVMSERGQTERVLKRR